MIQYSMDHIEEAQARISYNKQQFQKMKHNYNDYDQKKFQQQLFQTKKLNQNRKSIVMQPSYDEIIQNNKEIVDDCNSLSISNYFQNLMKNGNKNDGKITHKVYQNIIDSYKIQP